MAEAFFDQQRGFTMKLITKRLTIMSLDPEQLMLLATNIPALEKEITLTYHGEQFENGFREVIRNQARIAADDENNYLWHTFWLIVLDREIIGTIDFKNLPDKEGSVEIGFGLNRDFRNKGFMTETVTKFADWALRQEGVKQVIAETEKDNIPSQRVLEKAGFEKYRATQTHFWWMVSATMRAKNSASTNSLNRHHAK